MARGSNGVMGGNVSRFGGFGGGMKVVDGGLREVNLG